MLTHVFTVALLSLLLVDIHCQDSSWDTCSQPVGDSLRFIIDTLGKNQIILQDVSVCRKLTITLKDLQAHSECGVKNCDGDEPDCKEQKLSFHVKNFVFKCEIENAGVIMKKLVPKLPIIQAKGGVTVDGAWSELLVTLTYRVACAKGKGEANMTSSDIDSKTGSLSLSCSEGTGPLKVICWSAFKSTSSRDKVSKFAAETLEEKAPEMMKGISDNIASMNCQ